MNRINKNEYFISENNSFWICICNSKNELFSEIVILMGETLVGSYEGQKFSFIYNKENKNYDIKLYPNKYFLKKY